MAKLILKYFDWLCRENYKAFNLALVRVCICLWLLTRLFAISRNFDIIYGKQAISVANSMVLQSIHHQYFYFIVLYVIIIVLNLLGIGKNSVAILLYLFYYFFYHLNIGVVNGGDTITKYVLLYLAFANTYTYFTIHKNQLAHQPDPIENLLSNLASISIILQLCLVYFSSAIAKIHTPEWYNGQATYYAFLSERYGGGYLIKDWIKKEWFIKTSSYYALVFEFIFPLFIWFKKWRSSLLLAGIALHLGIAILMMLYSFQAMFILLYIIFLPNEKLKRWVQKITKRKSIAYKAGMQP